MAAAHLKSKWKLPSFPVSSTPRSTESFPFIDCDSLSDLLPLRAAGEARIFVNLPNYAAHIVPCPLDERTGKPVPGTSRLVGEVELHIPAGGRRVKAIRLIRREFSWLDLTNPDGWKVLDEAVTDLQGQLDLAEGVHRYMFNEVLPSTLTPTFIWHPVVLPQSGSFLFVQAIGAEPGRCPGHDFLDLSSVRWSHKSSAMAPPAYSSTGNGQNGGARPWLERTISHWVHLFVEPEISPNGDPVRLSDRFMAVVPELGVVQCRTYAENLSIAGPLVTRFRILSPSPKTTIFALHTSLEQQETVHTPEGAIERPAKVGKCVTIGSYESGCPVKDVLWQGTLAGGTDEGSFERTKNGRFPTTDNFWWSSVPGTKSPLDIEHKLVYEIYFSVYGQDKNGKDMETPGPGQVRKVRRTTKVFMPTCSAMPGLRGLPAYGTSISQADLLKPCRACGRPPVSQVCPLCPSTTLPHIAHDSGPDYCATCSGRSLVPRGQRNRETIRCACVDHTAWMDAGCPDEGLRIPDDEVDPRDAAMAREMRRDQMVAVKLDAEWSGKSDVGRRSNPVGSGEDIEE